MISILSEPDLKAEGERWTLVLWVCEPFDDEYSFRDLLAGITAILERVGPVTLTLPQESPGEDFIDGVLQWGPRTYQVYYERSLGYMQFSGTHQPQVVELLETVKGDLSWAAA